MKRFGNLYDKIYDLENIRLAHKNARKHKTKYKEVRMVDKNPEFYFKQIQDMLKNKTFRNGEYSIFTRKFYSKERVIYKLPYFSDRIIHHCILQVIGPIWNSVFIRNTFSSIKNRGIKDAVLRIKKTLHEHPDLDYCLKIDIKKFYPSVNHDILKGIIAKKIKDKDLLWLLNEIIDSASGVPIGNYLSQYFGNLYLSYFDHYSKEILKAKYYYRYCDDIVVLSNSKEKLRELLKAMRIKVDPLRVTIKENWQIFPIDKRGIDFLGYVFFKNHILIRKAIKQRFIKNLIKIAKSDILPSTKVTSGSMSFVGWMKLANTRNLVKKYFTKNVQSLVIKYGVSKRSVKNAA